MGSRTSEKREGGFVNRIQVNITTTTKACEKNVLGREGNAGLKS